MSYASGRYYGYDSGLSKLSDIGLEVQALLFRYYLLHTDAISLVDPNNVNDVTHCIAHAPWIFLTEVVHWSSITNKKCGFFWTLCIVRALRRVMLKYLEWMFLYPQSVLVVQSAMSFLSPSPNYYCHRLNAIDSFSSRFESLRAE